MSISPITPATPAPIQSTGNPAAAVAASTDKLANQSVFMQLLVAQLKNQDPEKPADGTQFVTQLAQFTTLEQDTQSRSDLDAILKVMQTAAQPVTAPAAPPSSNPTATTKS